MQSKPLMQMAAASVLALGSALPRAEAAPIVTYRNTDFNAAPATFSFGGGQATYTLSSTGDIFNPAAVTTSGTAMVNAFGGFLGIPIQPTTNFIDRGTVVFSPSDLYAAFPAATTIPFSNGGNFLGLSFTLGEGVHVGYAEFIDNVLLGYAYESTPGASITATNIVAPVPEPATLALLGSGIIGLGLVRRRSMS